VPTPGRYRGRRRTARDRHEYVAAGSHGPDGRVVGDGRRRERRRRSCYAPRREGGLREHAAGRQVRVDGLACQIFGNSEACNVRRR
jgi:hypothetical protein